MSDAKTTMKLLPNGPLMVEGDFTLLSHDGTEIAPDKNRVALCRCGASAKKPFCDGGHSGISFQG